MSHFTRLKTRIRDIEALMSCLREMGYRVEKGGTIGGFEGKRAVDVAVRMAQGYDGSNLIRQILLLYQSPNKMRMEVGKASSAIPAEHKH